MRASLLSTATLAATLAVLAPACGGASVPTAPTSSTTTPADAAPPRYRATVRWTSHGIPHIVADDLGSVAYGQGWAFATLHVCVLADQIVRVRGERARFFGAGEADVNVDSDFAHLHLGLRARGEAALATASADARAVLRGWVAGYNRYVAETPPDQLPAGCRGAAWVRPIDELDLASHAVGVAAIAASRLFTDELARAAPRTEAGKKTGRAPLPSAIPAAAPASNGWAIGAERSAGGRGVLVANPHFPWEGDMLFYESHLTVPGQLDVYGVSLVGLPLIAIGFTNHHAWTHTFSSSSRFVLYRLRLVDGQPLRYHRDDGIEAIVPTTYHVQVRRDDGTLEDRARTLYRSKLGPMLDADELPWDPAGGAAFTLRDVAIDAGNALDQYLAMARATSVEQFRAALANHGTPFLNTIYADRDGNALYVDASRVPALTPEALAGWQLARRAVPALEGAWRKGLPILDGSTAMFDLISDDPAAPGVVPVAAAPTALRRDFVMNANDSYRYTNPAQAWPDFSPLYGDDAGRPTTRTLMNLTLLREPGGAGSAAGVDGKFDRTEAAAAMLSNRSYTAEALKADVVARCRAVKKLKATCDVLDRWSGRYGVADRGAALWRELMPELAVDGRLPWATPFDLADPASARGLAAPGKGADPVPAAIGRAADRLRAAGVAVDAALGDVQRTRRSDRDFAIPGGTDLDGIANVTRWVDWNGTLLPRSTRGAVTSPAGLTAEGYRINYGTSFVLAVDYDDRGPTADVLLTYGQSSDPASPLHTDQLEAFGRGELRRALFDDAAIAADPGIRVIELDSTSATPAAP